MKVESCLQQLDEAIAAAEVLGIDSANARRVRVDAERRLGFPSDVYVLALVGGTGVGKSSLLNALAATVVTPVSVRRPTTRDTVAWVPPGSDAALSDLLGWLGV